MDTSLDQFKEIIDEKYPNSRDQTNDNFLAAVQQLSYAMIGYPRARDVLYKALRSEKLEKPIQHLEQINARIMAVHDARLL